MTKPFEKTLHKFRKQLEKVGSQDKLDLIIYRVIAQKLVSDLVDFDIYLRKQNLPKVYQRFRKVIKINE